MRGRTELPEGEKKQRLVVFVEKKKIDSIGSKRCVEISKDSIDKEYQRNLKSNLNK